MKKLYILVFISLLGYGASAQTPTLSWLNAMGGSGDDFITTMSVDPSGNVYIGGKFQGTVDFDPSVGGFAQHTAAGFGSTSDGFIAKYNSAGAFQWVVTFGNSTEDIVNNIKATSTGVFVTGYFSNSADFDPLGGGDFQSTDSGSRDMFIARYLPDGTLHFVNTAGSFDTDAGRSVSVDQNGDVFVAGVYYDQADFDPTNGDGTLYSWSGYDMFLAKYNDDGDYLWAVTLGSVGTDEATSVVAIGDDVWVGGYYGGDFYADPNDSEFTIGYLGATDGYFGKYNGENGSYIWGGTVRSASNQEAVNSLATDGTSLFVAGGFIGGATIVGTQGTTGNLVGKGNEDGFIARFSLDDARFLWANVVGGTGKDYVDAIAAESGQVYASGTFTSSSMDVDPSGTTWNLTAQGGSFDAFLLKYNYANGAFVYGLSFGGLGSDESLVVTTGAGSTYYGGMFEGLSVDLDPSGSTTRSSNAGYDMYFGKLVPQAPTLSSTGINFAPVGSVTFNVGFANIIFPDGYLTLLKQGSAPTFTPVDGTTYTKNQTVPDGSKVLFIGPETLIPVGNATPNTTYYVTVFPYNGSGATIKYKTTSPLASNVTTVTPATEPTVAPSAFTTSNITYSSATVAFTTAGASATSYIGIRTLNGVPDTDPTDGIVYAVGNKIGNAVVAFVGTAVSYAQSSLEFGADYNYKVYSANGSGAQINYRTATILQGLLTVKGAKEPTSGPSDIVFKNLKTTGFDYIFTKSTDPNVSGYLVVRKEGAAPTYVPVDGVVPVDQQQNADLSQSNIIPTTTTNISFGGTPNTRYYFVVYAFSGTGPDVNYLQSSPAKANRFTLDPAGDLTPPVVVDNTPATIPPNVAVPVSVKVNDPGSDVQSVTIKYSSITSREEFDGVMTRVNDATDIYTFTIPATLNVNQGVEYQLTATDYTGNVRDVPFRSVINVHGEDGLTIPYTSPGKSQANYRIISVPLNLEKKSVSDVFSDDLGELKKSKYRLFRYSGTSTSELSSSSTIDIGKGYWLIASDAATIDSGPGTTADVGASKPVTISITNGWNQIGNPFAFDVKWSDVVDFNDGVTISRFKTHEGEWGNGSLLKKMSGGFVMIDAAGTDGLLTIPQYIESARKAAPTPVNFARTLDSDTWAVDLLLKSGDQKNAFAGFGMHPSAKEQNDKFDDYTLPRFIDYLELNFNKKLYGSAFTRDIVPTSNQHTWEFQVESNLSDEITELRWDNSYFGAADLQLVLWDVEQQRAVDMKKEDHYAFEANASGSFRIFFGDKNFVKAETRPTHAVFHSASPVPSATNITFGFSVPESNEQVSTSLAVYNLMGQKVATLVDGSVPAGYQQAVWNIEDGTKPAVGMYISVLKFGNTTLQKRLIIK